MSAHRLAYFGLFLTVVAKALAVETECSGISDGGRTLGLKVTGKRNSSGDWVAFSAIMDSKNSADVAIDVKHKIIDCDGRAMVAVYGILRETNTRDVPILIFSLKSGENAAVINGGNTAQKINANDGLNGVLLTNRPLNDNELFEVVLEKKGTKFSYSMGIGLTAITDEILPHLNRVKNGTWMYYGADVWRNGEKIREAYGKNIYELAVGDRVGVMRSDNGVLRFYVNGVDQGAAVSNLPGNLYGAFELFGSALQVSITSPR